MPSWLNVMNRPKGAIHHFRGRELVLWALTSETAPSRRSVDPARRPRTSRSRWAWSERWLAEFLPAD